jgi:hypothetical protein
MPTIEVPLQSWTDIPALRKSKKFTKLADRAIELARQEKVLKAARQELSLELFDILDEVLDDQTKSIAYEGATLTKRAGGQTSKFDKKKLMTMPIPCSNPKCKTDNHVTVDIIEACTKKSDRRPGVSIKLPGEEENGDE